MGGGVDGNGVRAAGGEFGGKDLSIRFGGYNLPKVTKSRDDHETLTNGTNYYNSLLMFDFTDNANSTLSNPYVEYYDNNRYAGPDTYSKGLQHLWHPQKWRSMTIYTQKTDDEAVKGGVNARLVFGPFAAKNDQDISYLNWGRYAGNPWYGQAKGDNYRALPGNGGTTEGPKTRKGMIYIPEYFGNNFRMFFIDNPSVATTTDTTTTSKNVMIIQGVNILGTEDQHSVIYSRRGVELGGGLEKSLDEASSDNKITYRGYTTRGVNNGNYGISRGTASHYPNYFAITARYSQIIYNTDIVLRTPSGTSTPRISYILDALLPTDGIYGNNTNFSDEENKKYTPTVRIIGGYMFVGAGQRLEIEGGRLNPKKSDEAGKAGEAKNDADFSLAVSTGGTVKEKTLIVSPASLTVESGGRVIIKKSKLITASQSPYANVTTDMSVNGTVSLAAGAYAGGNAVIGNGGEFTLAANARYDGNIHVTNGGSLTLGASSRYVGDVVVGNGGAATLAASARCAGNIYVENGGTLTIGSSTIVGDIQIEHGGTITIGAGALITGDVRCAGTMNITGNITLNYSPTPGSPGAADEYMYHGIFIYNDPEIGRGKLTLTGAPVISGTSGRVHVLTGYSLPYNKADGDKTFCNDRAEDDNTCRHWATTSGKWHKQGDSSHG
jgi:hypothetical protein